MARDRHFRKGKSPPLRPHLPSPSPGMADPARGEGPGAPAAGVGAGGGRGHPAASADTWRPPRSRPTAGPALRGGSQERVTGAENKAPPLGKAGWRRGREITFWGPSGCSLSARSLLKGGPTPRQRWTLESYPKASSPSQRLHICPSFPPASLGGPRDPPSLRAAPAQSQAGGGEEPFRGPLAWKPQPAPAVPRTARAPPRAAQLQQPQTWVPTGLRRSGANFPEPPLPARPGSLRAADAKPRAPPPPPPRPPRSPGPSSSANAPAPLRPNLPPPKGPGARARRVCFKLGSAGGALWPRSLRLPGSPAGTPAAAVPGLAGGEPATPGAAAGRRAPTHVEPVHIIERGAPAQAPLRGAPEPPALSGGTRAAPTDGGSN